MPRSAKFRERAAVFNEVALTLQHVQAHCGLAVLERRKVLRHRNRNRCVARNNLFDKPAHRFKP